MTTHDHAPNRLPKQATSPRRRQVLAAAILTTCTLSARANTDTWIGPTGNWNTGSNWSLATPPATGDTASLTQSDALNRTVTLDISPPSLTALTVDSTGAGLMTLAQSSNTLTANTAEYIGYSGAASYAQTGGTNNASDLYLGYDASATGAYFLSTGSLATLKTNNQYVGYNGTASFTQSRGTNSVSSTASLFLAYNAGSSASYSLTGGRLIAGTAYLGGSATSSGGAANLTISVLGAASFSSLKIWNSSGTSLSLAGGSLSVGSLDVDPSQFKWSDGALSITNPTNFTLGPTSILGPSLNLSNKNLFLAGSLAAPVGTAVNISGGTLSLGAPSQVDAPLTLSSGYLSGAGDLTVSSLKWSGGSMTGTGRTIIPSSGTLSITANNYNTLSRTLDNNGSATLSGTGAYTLNGTFNNNAGATLTITQSPHGYSGSGTLINSGTIIKTGTDSASLVARTFNNTGPAASVSVQAGTLSLYATGVHSAPFTVSAGATLAINPGNASDIINIGATFNTGATVTAAGNLLFTGGHTVFNDTVKVDGTLSVPYSARATFNATATLNAFTIAGGGGIYFNATPTLAPSTYTLTYGTLAGTADVTVPAGATFNWTDGYLGDPTNLPNSAKFTIAQGAAANIQAGTNQLLSRPLVNAGNFTITPLGSSLGTMSFLSGASLTNLPGATFTLDNLNYSGNIQLWTNDTPTTFFNNAGTFVKTGSLSTTFDTIRVPFNNDGPQASVTVQSGTLALAGDGNHSAPFTIAANATLELGLYGGSQTFNHGATVTGAGAGALVIDGGTATFYDSINLTGPLSLPGSAAVTIKANAAASSLSMGRKSTLDLTTASLQLNYAAVSPIDTIRQYLLAGQLTSSSADPIHRLGYLDSGFSLLVQLTLAGDANLNGTIDPDDYALLDRAYARSTTNAHWTDGDFNYDGTVDQNDYLLIDTTLGQAQGFSPGFLSHRESQFGATYVSTLLASVPEPSSLASLLLLRPLTRRRRRGDAPSNPISRRRPAPAIGSGSRRGRPGRRTSPGCGARGCRRDASDAACGRASRSYRCSR